MGKDYVELGFPWHSKSKLNSDDYCKYEYYDKHILKNPTVKQRSAVEGTNMHMVFSMFFNDLKEEDIMPFIDMESTVQIKNHPFKDFVYKICMEYVKPSERGHPYYINIINNFATLETQRFIELCNRLTNKKEICYYFTPLKTEERYEIDLVKWYGTWDRIDIMIAPNASKKIMIIDYKTGNVPTKIKEGPRNPSDQFTWNLASNKMLELHFYGIGYLLKAGWQLSEEVIDFLMNPKWWFYTKDNMTYEESKEFKKSYLKSLNTNKNNRWKMHKDGRELKQGDIILCIYYLGGDRPYKVMKEFNTTSYGAVIRASNDLRSRDYNQIYVDKPDYVFNEFVCSNYKRCSRVEECKSKVQSQ